MEKDSLNINLIDKTSILNLSYRDTDKDLIIPVLEKISFGYQEYSGKKRNRQLELGKIFFDEQIKLYKQKTLQSLKNVETFALENELAIIPMEQVTENNISSQNEYIPETNSMLVNIEKIRTQNLSILKDSKNQLYEINQIGDDPEKIIYIGSLIPELVATGLPEKLKEIDYKIELNKLRYKDSDIAITKLIEERDYLN